MNIKKLNPKAPAKLQVSGVSNNKVGFYFEVDGQVIEINLEAISNRDGSILKARAAK